MVTRRAFLGTLTGGLLAAPLAAEAQQAGGKVNRVSFLTQLPVPDLFEALRQGLRALGWTEGENFVLEEHATTEEKVSALAAELARSNVDVIVITATAIPYLGNAAANTPVVFGIGEDPIRAGYVASLAKPGGHMTGLTSLNIGLDAKRLEILKAALPRVRHVGALTIRRDPAHAERVAAIDQSARALGLHIKVLEASSAEGLPEAFDAASRAHVGALMVLGVLALRSYQRQIVVLGAKARLPVISAWRELPDAGGLMSYGTDAAFLGTLAGGLLAAPLAAHAQPSGKVYRVGILTNKASDPAEARLLGCSD